MCFFIAIKSVFDAVAILTEEGLSSTLILGLHPANERRRYFVM